jgi:hypothetical protein
VPIIGIILKAKAVEFNKLLSRHETFKASKGQLQRYQGTCQINTEGESSSGDSTAASQFPEILHKATEQLHNHNKTALYYRLLPNKL